MIESGYIFPACEECANKSPCRPWLDNPEDRWALCRVCKAFKWCIEAVCSVDLPGHHLADYGDTPTEQKATYFAEQYGDVVGWIGANDKNDPEAIWEVEVGAAGAVWFWQDKCGFYVHGSEDDEDIGESLSRVVPSDLFLKAADALRNTLERFP